MIFKPIAITEGLALMLWMRKEVKKKKKIKDATPPRCSDLKGLHYKTNRKAMVPKMHTCTCTRVWKRKRKEQPTAWTHLYTHTLRAEQAVKAPLKKTNKQTNPRGLGLPKSVTVLRSSDFQGIWKTCKLSENSAWQLRQFASVIQRSAKETKEAPLLPERPH